MVDPSFPQVGPKIPILDEHFSFEISIKTDVTRKNYCRLAYSPKMKTDTARELTRETTLWQMAKSYLNYRNLMKQSNARGVYSASIFGFIAGLFALPIRHDPEK